MLSNRLPGQQAETASPQDGQEAAAQAPARVRVASGVAASLLVKRVNPEYPKELRKKRIQGMVALKILISREGDVSQVTPISGNPTLVSLAGDAVKQWKFKPYLLQRQPIEVETTILINFTLAGS